MRNKNQVFKYYTPWQVARIKVKGFKDLDDKLDYIDLFLQRDLTVNNLKRAINWGYGLQISLQKESEDWYMVGNFIMFWETAIEDITMAEYYEERPDRDVSFDEYDKELLIKLFKDLHTRARKWAKNHYYNKELLTYLQSLADYLDRDITELIIQSNTDDQKSTHKFIY